MASTINKLRLINFKRFRDYTIEPNERMNILVGDNEVGKSTILEAIDLVVSGNVRRIEAIGLDKLLNIDAVNEFIDNGRDFESLPEMRIELYLSGNFDWIMNGKNNLDKRECDGIRLICEPNPDYSSEIKEALAEDRKYFPYEYYSIRFSTFADHDYSRSKKNIRCITIDSSKMNSEYATNDFVKRMYIDYTEDNIKERVKHRSEYRSMRNHFTQEHLEELNQRIHSERMYKFGLKSGQAMNIDGDLMIYENEVGIDNKGMGEQTFIKTDFALKRAGENIDVILIEEPENHLSPVNLRKLVQQVADTQQGQMFITTHNSLISARLELTNLLIMHANSDTKPVMLKELNDDTAKYFVKAPPANIVEFALAQKALLVEGPSEYMLLEKFYEIITGHKPEQDQVHIIDIRGLSFERYLEIAQLTGSQVAVLTDNDGNAQNNCVKKYVKYANDKNIKVFYEDEDSKYTFEVVLYNMNKDLCDDIFKNNDNDALTFMLNNKTESAYRLLTQEKTIQVPGYIESAIEWIRS